MKVTKEQYSYVAAAALAMVTLITFYTFRDYGPASAIRRFHRAALRNDQQELDAVSMQGASSPATAALALQVQHFGTVGASYDIVAIQRVPRYDFAIASVEYQLPNGMHQGQAWYVQRKSSQWLVDAYSTLARGR